jgi:hypothetical protein
MMPGVLSPSPLRRPRLVLLVATLVLMAPTLVVGTTLSHSSQFNLMWAQQFAEQIQAGVLYPRWLPQSFEQLGSPAFYFYPPLAFWVDALVGLLTLDALSVPRRLAIAATLLLWASGLAMHAWLQRVTGNALRALVGSLAYMAAPYHLLDHYLRGAFAEFASFAVLPLVALGVLLVGQRHRVGPGLLALAYAALLMTHLPTALLVSVTVLPPYVLYHAWRQADARAAASFLVRVAGAGVLGIGVAAVYLLPALTLQGSISANLLWIEYFRVQPWFLVRPDRWPDPDFMRIVAAIALAYVLATLALALAVRGGPVGERRQECAFWLAVSLLCLVLMSGLVPWFWELPELGKVQFPWRLLVVVEFAVITAWCLALPLSLRRPVRYLLVGATAALVPAVVWIGAETALRIATTRAAGVLETGDSPEYQPAGYSHPYIRGSYVDQGLETLARLPIIDCVPAARRCRAESGPLGAMRIEIDSDRPTAVTLRRFYFPGWSLNPPRPIVPAEPLRLVSFVAPAGSGTFQLARTPVAAEHWGWLVSGASLGLVLLWLLYARRAR